MDETEQTSPSLPWEIIQKVVEQLPQIIVDTAFARDGVWEAEIRRDTRDPAYAKEARASQQREHSAARLFDLASEVQSKLVDVMVVSHTMYWLARPVFESLLVIDPRKLIGYLSEEQSDSDNGFGYYRNYRRYEGIDDQLELPLSLQARLAPGSESARRIKTVVIADFAFCGCIKGLGPNAFDLLLSLPNFSTLIVHNWLKQLNHVLPSVTALYIGYIDQSVHAARAFPFLPNLTRLRLEHATDREDEEDEQHDWTTDEARLSWPESARPGLEQLEEISLGHSCEKASRYYVSWCTNARRMTISAERAFHRAKDASHWPAGLIELVITHVETESLKRSSYKFRLTEHVPICQDKYVRIGKDRMGSYSYLDPKSQHTSEYVGVRVKADQRERKFIEPPPPLCNLLERLPSSIEVLRLSHLGLQFYKITKELAKSGYETEFYEPIIRVLQRLHYLLGTNWLPRLRLLSVRGLMHCIDDRDRQHYEDVEELAEHFIREIDVRCGARGIVFEEFNITGIRARPRLNRRPGHKYSGAGGRGPRPSQWTPKYQQYSSAQGQNGWYRRR